MVSRRQFLTRTLRASSLVALGSVVPQFVARTARAAAPGKDTVLVVLEMSGGNDGLNTVIPYADDLYHKARPTLRHTQDAVIRLDDRVGLHPGMTGLRPLGEQGQLAVVQGVGYPNPDRSHFEAMDIWQSADPRRATPTGWLGRAPPGMDHRARGGAAPAPRRDDAARRAEQAAADPDRPGGLRRGGQRRRPEHDLPPRPGRGLGPRTRP